MAMPTRDALLVPFSTNFNDRIVASPTTYGTTASAAAAYEALHDPYIAAAAAVVAARAAGVRTGPLWATRNSARAALLRYGRELYKTIQSSITVTDAAKIELGIKVPDVQPTPFPVPGFAPGLNIVSVNGRTVRVRVFDPADVNRRARPVGTAGAIVLSHVGETAPENPLAYSMQGTTGKTSTQVVFPVGVAPGSKVWLCAAWFNGSKQMGPACNPVSTHVGYDGAMPIAA